MKIIIDTREQLPYAFASEYYEGTTTERDTLTVGDYSLAGLTDLVAVERKSLDDLLGCLTRERERFERELQRAAALESFMVVIEGSEDDLLGGKYRSRMNTHSAYQSIAAFEARYKGVRFRFAGDRGKGEYFTHSFLRQFLRETYKRLDYIKRAHGTQEE